MTCIYANGIVGKIFEYKYLSDLILALIKHLTCFKKTVCGRRWLRLLRALSQAARQGLQGEAAKEGAVKSDISSPGRWLGKILLRLLSTPHSRAPVVPRAVVGSGLSS